MLSFQFNLYNKKIKKIKKERVVGGGGLAPKATPYLHQWMGGKE